MSTTKIEWTDKTWNPITGCSPISEGCRNCYAARIAKWLQKMGMPGYENGFAVTYHPGRLNEPMGWKKPQKIFVCSMGDLFHEDVSISTIDMIWETIIRCSHHTFIILTKRIERAVAEYKNGFVKNVWFGVTAEDQPNADRRIPELLKLRKYFPVLFVSVEPMLGPVALTHIRKYYPDESYFDINVLQRASVFAPHISWVICGGETGPGARLMNPQWARDLRDQCIAAGVPFFFKKMGSAHTLPKEHQHLLDGREWKEWPKE